MLMVLSQCSWGDDVPVRRFLTSVNGDNAHDSGGSSLDCDGSGLIKFVGEYVFVVGERDDELDDEFATPGYDCAAGAPVRVLPADSVVLFMQADYVGAFGDCAVAGCCGSIEVLGLWLVLRL
jgi:hypothetical protein